MEASPIPSLPYDLYATIVDHLHDDVRTLQACCLAGSAWVHPTRQHLFRSVVVTVVDQSRNDQSTKEKEENGRSISLGVEAFRAFLERNPLVGALVRKVEIRGGDENARAKGYVVSPPNYGAPFCYHDLAGLLANLPNLSSICLKHLHLYCRRVIGAGTETVTVTATATVADTVTVADTHADPAGTNTKSSSSQVNRSVVSLQTEPSLHPRTADEVYLGDCSVRPHKVTA